MAQNAVSASNKVMEMLGSYFNDVFIQAAILLCSLDISNGKTIFVFSMTVINFISLSILLGKMFLGSDTYCATPFFWLVSGIFTFGISMLVYWIIYFAEKKKKRNVEMCNINFIWLALIPTVCAAVICVVSGTSEYGFDVGFVALLLLTGILYLWNEKKGIILKANSENAPESVGDMLEELEEIYSDRKLRSGFVRWNNEEGDSLERIEGKTLETMFLLEEHGFEHYIKKTYVFGDKKLDVIQVRSVSVRMLWSAMAGFMILTMLFTPYFLECCYRIIGFLG